MSGLDSQGRPYELIASKAVQSLTGGGIDLEDVRAKVATDDNTTANITAASGHYEQQGKTLQLGGGITVKTTSGVTITMPSAVVDVAGGDLKGQGPGPYRNAEPDAGRLVAAGDRGRQAPVVRRTGEDDPRSHHGRRGADGLEE